MARNFKEWARGIQDPSPEDPEFESIFSNLLAPGANALTIPILPSKTSLAGYCYWNVESCCDKLGGKLIFGWQVTTIKRFFVQAVHHAVWEAPDGRLIDPTPKLAASPHSGTFCPDGSDLNFHAFDRFPKRVWAVKHQDAQEWKRYDLMYDRLRIEQVKFGTASNKLSDFERLDRPKWKKAEQRMLHRASRRGEECLCGSGKSYGRCHGL
ncbi:SEC-C domain-containing protein [Pelagovum pacificum]|uniref:SEC-C domain-containing protein n=1 Tax=Pelagovum pacificum TaxID=2588711 RepID=UPI0018CDD2A1|nr:SEC-C domain-containing protein [Pelagovum pacificum]QQA43963.1 SEC-C domain-containing protein [Pelagovum pacificum]